MRKFKWLLCVMGLYSAMSMAESNQGLSVVFENNSNHEILELYVSPNQDYSDEKNILGDTPLKSGESINVSVSKSRDHCAWVITYKDADGLTSSSVETDICRYPHYSALGGVNDGGAKDSQGNNTGSCNWEKEGTEIGELMTAKFKGAITPESDEITAGMNNALNAAIGGDIPKACEIYNGLRKKLGG